MASLRNITIGIGLATGTAGVAGGVAYSQGLFNSNTQISKLIEEENKYALLPTNGTEYTTEWNEAWERYRDGSNNKWQIPSEVGVIVETAPESFKNTCQQKVTERVKDKTDQKYKDITDYCSRPKKLSEVLEKEGINLLATTGKETEWKEKFNSYKTSNNQIPDVTVTNTEDTEQHFNKLREGCKTALTRKTTDSNYTKTYDAVKVWCKV